MSSEIPHLKERLAEAARYALMRRLLPAIRHNLAGTLQPIGMMSAMLDRRIKAAVPDMAQLAKNTQALGTLSREAAATSLNLMTWLAPKDNELIAVNSAVEESLGLMATELSFRGFSLDNQATGAVAKLPKGMLRSVFTASLIALTDTFEKPAGVVIGVEGEAGDTRLRITVEADASNELLVLGNRMPTYRCLQWSDVQALADAEGVHIEYAPDSVQLKYSGVSAVVCGQ
ncbi:hypothetical protein [Polaromonas sp. CG9_12]|uniref:hypothetical protein n=1 Tax=Polaromonas sp. CG_9.11 TaxID=2787730 RepID=UPI0004DDD2DD|nr:hypothetical protein [Polaromonas sp. CG_9.11]MBG6076019.1 hypothetical protein [Polaromonas sp. CG_9.11]CDS51330.1 hypothetical protein [Polaromonas sp. CG9_12]